MAEAVATDPCGVGQLKIFVCAAEEMLQLDQPEPETTEPVMAQGFQEAAGQVPAEGALDALHMQDSQKILVESLSEWVQQVCDKFH